MDELHLRNPCAWLSGLSTSRLGDAPDHMYSTLLNKCQASFAPDALLLHFLSKHCLATALEMVQLLYCSPATLFLWSAAAGSAQY